MGKQKHNRFSKCSSLEAKCTHLIEQWSIFTSSGSLKIVATKNYLKFRNASFLKI